MERSPIVPCACFLAAICVCLAMPGTAVAQPAYPIPPSTAPRPIVAQRYEAASLTSPPVVGTSGTAPAAEGRVSVRLRDGSCLVGELLDLEELAMETAFGQVTIPRKLVAHIQLAGPPKAATLCFGNGDRLTGQLTLGTVRLKTSFGEVSIETEQILSVACGTVSHTIYRPVVETGPDGTVRTRYVAEQVTRCVPTVPAISSTSPYPGASYMPTPTAVPALTPPPPVYRPPTLPAPTNPYQPVPAPAGEAPSLEPLR